MHLVGFIIRMYQDAWSSECQIHNQILNSNTSIQNSCCTEKYRISRPIRRTFSPKKCDLYSTCVLCAEGKYYFQTYKYPLSAMSEHNHENDFSGSDDDFLGLYDE